MKPEPRFLSQPKDFWANVRLVTQEVGYTERRTGRIKIPTAADIRKCFHTLSLDVGRICTAGDTLADFGANLIDYFHFRAEVINDSAKPFLMDAAEARRQFQLLRARLRPKCPIPMNKQKGKKKQPAYFTGIVNMLIEANAQGFPCEYNPLKLTTVSRQRSPVRTLARRVDGAFPSPVNPIAVWEVKEYYYTTTFGSRVADGVYETLLDGMELEELRRSKGIHVRHYLMVDGRYTWWECGKSYLCRIVDMLHMGYVDEVLFGKEAIERMPELVREWVSVAKRQRA